MIKRRKEIPPTPAQCYIIDRVTIDGNGCWIWNGAVQTQGYATGWCEGKTRRAHKMSYEAFIDSVPFGMVVMHSCDVRKCVNPHHLFVGTNQDNSDDMIRKARQVCGTSHHLSRLDEIAIQNIRQDIRNGQAIAEDYGVSKQTIYAIQKRKTWKHV